LHHDAGEIHIEEHTNKGLVPSGGTRARN